jgi:FMN phosphatase YigB (HAD superfamily)
MDRLTDEIIGMACKLLQQSKPAHGIDVVKKLRLRYPVCMLTNSTRSFTEPILKRLGTNFDTLLFGDEVLNKIEGFKAVAKEFKIKPAEMLYIADMLHDAENCRKFGCRCVLISACSFDKKKLLKMKSAKNAKNPDILSDLSKLSDYLNNL